METLESKYGIYPPKYDAWKSFADETPPDGIVWVKDEGWDEGLSRIVGSVKGTVNIKCNSQSPIYDLWQLVVFVNQSKNAQPEPAAPPAYPYRKGDWIVCENVTIRVSSIQSFEPNDVGVTVYTNEADGRYYIPHTYETFISLLTQ